MAKLTEEKSDLKDSTQELIEEALDLYTDFVEKWGEVGSAVRKLGLQQTYDRVDAYPGWQHGRDSATVKRSDAAASATSPSQMRSHGVSASVQSAGASRWRDRE